MMMMIMIVVVSIPFYDEGGRSPRDDEQWLMLVPLSRCENGAGPAGQVGATALHYCFCAHPFAASRPVLTNAYRGVTLQLAPLSFGRPYAPPIFSRIRRALCSPAIFEGPF